SASELRQLLSHTFKISPENRRPLAKLQTICKIHRQRVLVACAVPGDFFNSFRPALRSARAALLSRPARFGRGGQTERPHHVSSRLLVCPPDRRRSCHGRESAARKRQPS